MSFKESFPELTDAGDPLIEAKLAEAENTVGAIGGIIGTVGIRDTLVSYQTAHLVALSPYGFQAKLVSKLGTTTYGNEYERRCLTLGPSMALAYSL